MTRPSTAFSIYGTKKDKRPTSDESDKWRPTINLCTHPELRVTRLELLVVQKRYRKAAEKLRDDLQDLAPHVDVHLHLLVVEKQAPGRGPEAKTQPESTTEWNPRDFKYAFAALWDYIGGYEWDEGTDYYYHLTTGTTALQVSAFLLAERHYFTGKLIQSFRTPQPLDQHIIDLDSRRYEAIARRQSEEEEAARGLLSEGIETKSEAFACMVRDLERVASRSEDPILLTGPTGVGKTRIAQRIHELKQDKAGLTGRFVAVNCAALGGDLARSALFGHVKGAYTGAEGARTGYLLEANGGLLFLDEVGELSLEVQRLLLTAIETGRFRPEGAEEDVESSFQLISGTNRDLYAAVRDKSFRADLFARINLWHFSLPSLRERVDDLAPNIDLEVRKRGTALERKFGFEARARKLYLAFATSPSASWNANFRDLKASIGRMETMAESGKITPVIVEAEVERLEEHWKALEREAVQQSQNFVKEVLGNRADEYDPFDLAQLEYVLSVCRQPNITSQAAAGRVLFAKSRERKKSSNDTKRLGDYLRRFGLDWKAVRLVGRQ